MIFTGMFLDQPIKKMEALKSGDQVRHIVEPYVNSGRAMVVDSIENDLAICSFEDKAGAKQAVRIPVTELEEVRGAGDYMVIF